MSARMFHPDNHPPSPEGGSSGSSSPPSSPDTAAAVTSDPSPPMKRRRNILALFAVPVLSVLTAFLGYGSQLLYYAAGDSARPGPLTPRQALYFNAALLCVWWCYIRTCTVSPGLYTHSPPGRDPGRHDLHENTDTEAAAVARQPNPYQRYPGTRWCFKCRAPKPPRAHHCRHCGRCIPRMDHHCPWVANCVSLTTLPHFLRYLVWANVAFCMFWRFWFVRTCAVWEARYLPWYLGPSGLYIGGLTVLAICGALLHFLCLVMLVRTAWNWVINQTSIESCEAERHEAQVARGRDWWHDDDEDDGEGSDSKSKKRRLEKTEFPYDVGFFRNMAQAMGASNPLLWFCPLAGGPVMDPDGTGTGVGWEWEENGLNDREGMWPPYNPDKARWTRRVFWPGSSRALLGDSEESGSPHMRKAAFLARQRADLERQRRRQRDEILVDLEEVPMPPDGVGSGMSWTMLGGGRDTPADLGVDEEAEEAEGGPAVLLVGRDGTAPDEDDVPLGTLLRRRQSIRVGGHE